MYISIVSSHPLDLHKVYCRVIMILTIMVTGNMHMPPTEMHFFIFKSCNSYILCMLFWSYRISYEYNCPPTLTLHCNTCIHVLYICTYVHTLYTYYARMNTYISDINRNTSLFIFPSFQFRIISFVLSYLCTNVICTDRRR
jgi:hypothetical protein